MTPEPGVPLARFRPSLAPMLRVAGWAFACAVAIGAPLAIWKGRSPEELARGLLAAGLVFAALGPLLALIVRPLGLRVHAAGLVGRTYWGPRRLLAWSSISGLRIDAASGVSLLCIEDRDGGPPLWTLPDVVRRPEFQRLAAELGGRDHPLVFGDGLGGELR